MDEGPLDLGGRPLLVTNDDGIHAPGLAVLERIAARLAREVWVVAPETEQSGAGHSLTINRPLRLRHIEGRRYAVDGTPTDCVLMAVHKLMRDCRPGLVLSGVNRGANMGEDITYSGTVAATMEATLLGVPAIALSQHLVSRERANWAVTEAWAERAIRPVVERGWPGNTLINVNFPDGAPGDVAGVRVVRQGRRKVGDEIVRGVDPRGRPYYWIGAMHEEDATSEGTDVAAVHDGWVAVTPIKMDMTHTDALAPLAALFR